MDLKVLSQLKLPLPKSQYGGFHYNQKPFIKPQSKIFIKNNINSSKEYKDRS